MHMQNKSCNWLDKNRTFLLVRMAEIKWDGMVGLKAFNAKLSSKDIFLQMIKIHSFHK